LTEFRSFIAKGSRRLPCSTWQGFHSCWCQTRC